MTRPGLVLVVGVSLLALAWIVVSQLRRNAFVLQGDVLWVWFFAGSAVIVGAIVLRSQPGHGVGRVCLGGGAMLAIGYASMELGYTLHLPSRHPLMAAILFAAMLATLALITLGPVLAAVFPSGRLGTTGRRIALVIMAVSAPLLLVNILGTAVFVNGDLVAVNPFYVRGWRADQVVDGSALLIGVYAVSLALSLVALAVRYVRSDALGRRQIRWVSLNLTALVAVVALTYLDPGGIGENTWWLMLVLIGLTPASVGVAVLRYRLYDVDRIVSNTVAYGLVTLVLVSIFWVVNLALQRVLSDALDATPIITAASTLLVAALFNPVRLRVQRFVDRRFHRAHYDAQRTVDSLASRLRQETDLAALRTEIEATVGAAIEPSNVRLWLREPRAATR